MDTKDPEKWDEALDGPLKEFETGHANDTGDKAEQMRRWAADGHYRQCNDKVKTHVDRKSRGKHYPPMNAEEEIAFPAAFAENEGNFDEAKIKWAQLQQMAGQAPWGVYAAIRLSELNKVESEAARLRKKLGGIREFRAELEADTPDLDLLTALRYEDFGDFVEAYQRFDQLKTKLAGDPNRHVAYLLAARQANALKSRAAVPGDPVEMREKLLRRKLNDMAEATKSDNYDAAYEICLHIIALYGDNAETTIQKLVEEARTAKLDLRKKMGMPAAPGD
jgi:hypothetical protein